MGGYRAPGPPSALREVTKQDALAPATRRCNSRRQARAHDAGHESRPGRRGGREGGRLARQADVPRPFSCWNRPLTAASKDKNPMAPIGQASPGRMRRIFVGEAVASSGGRRSPARGQESQPPPPSTTSLDLACMASCRRAPSSPARAEACKDDDAPRTRPATRSKPPDLHEQSARAAPPSILM